MKGEKIYTIFSFKKLTFWHFLF